MQSDSQGQPQEKPARPERRQYPEVVITEIHRRLDQGDERFSTLENNLKANTEATQATQAAVQTIANNTNGIVSLVTDLEAGTKFLCRLAMAIKWLLKDVVEPYWKPVLVIFVVVSLVLGRRLPDWLNVLFKAIFG